MLIDGWGVVIHNKGGPNLIQDQKQNLYNVKQNTWHHLKVSKRAKVLVVENSNTTKENTQTYFLKDDK